MIEIKTREIEHNTNSETVHPQGCMEIQALDVYYGGNTILKGIDLIFHPGKVTAIIGPSGCGKTTLLRCLNRLSELSKNCRVRGQILLDGENILKMDPILLRRRVGMVFQKPNPFPKSIRENILYGVKAIKLKVDHDAVVRSCLEKAALWNELKGRLNESALTLSIGQQQRLCIARTLAINPEVILLDEPASALDPVSTATLEASIMTMKGEYTQVIVTHNMNEALKISDYVAFLYMGELVEYGETAKVFNHPERTQTSDYINGKIY